MNMIFWRNPPSTRDFVRAEGIPPRGALPAVVGVLAKLHQQPSRELHVGVFTNMGANRTDRVHTWLEKGWHRCRLSQRPVYSSLSPRRARYLLRASMTRRELL
jgi:hypothetical protein